MHLKELTPGTTVTLEILKQLEAFEIVSTVMGTWVGDENSILIKPVEFKGKVTDLDGRTFYKENMYNLYATDHDERFLWANVEVGVREYKGGNYYIVKTKPYLSNGEVSDRRDHKRYPVKLPGNMTIQRNANEISVEVNDISDNGISFFYTGRELNLVGERLLVCFTDTVNDNVYDLKIDARGVRQMEKEEGNFCGCSIVQPNQQMLRYIYVKKVLDERKKKDSLLGSDGTLEG